MDVGVGYSEHHDTEMAGTEAVQQAMAGAGRDDPCDLVLLFSTVQHDPQFLRSVVSSIAGESIPIVGGGAIGTITNDRFGYAGDQVGVAAFWFDKVEFELIAGGSLVDNENEVGMQLGRLLAERGATRDTPAMLFFDAINRTRGDLRLNLATPLLSGLKHELGFLPRTLVGAGFMGDYEASATKQWNGETTVEHTAMILTFSGGLRIDSVIMHGCRPAGEYYTVTRAEGQTILEVNGQPAIPFIESQLHPALPAEEFPFFMIFGVNSAPEGEFDEKNYANHLCLAIDKERDGIVMFESDMIEGTQFQIMYRSLDLDYIPPKINAVFDGLGKRRPVFSFYIDCAGRAARESGYDMEDAIVVQKTVAGRAPLLGIYSGVEIAPIRNQPRPLDWTGVFCLFSMPV